MAYVDPGNVAANLTTGASYGYLLARVLVVANASAVLVQYLSAKLGIVTGRSLPELRGKRMRRMPRLLFWAQAEIVAVATGAAEIVGGAIALHLLFGSASLPAGSLPARSRPLPRASRQHPSGRWPVTRSSAGCCTSTSRRCSGGS
ncbi:Nramp family divalent metal transporter [Amycolatopsis ultiminotia]|uniref:Nramp family divalent metal transporter n=1 Tax=Amycolatopsis ultiminotia TaxID=543629 RepID=UPI003CD08B4E